MSQLRAAKAVTEKTDELGRRIALRLVNNASEVSFRNRARVGDRDCFGAHCRIENRREKTGLQRRIWGRIGNGPTPQKLLVELGYQGYGRLRPEGVGRQLEKMTNVWKGPPPLLED